EQEDALRQSLIQIDTTSAAAARTAILELESAHAPRRESVWAKLQQAPLAFALGHRAHIVRETSVASPAGSVPTMQNYYTSTGWTIDAAALSALSSVTAAGDRTAIESALHAIYTPWLWTTAQHFQQAVLNQP